MGTHPLFKLALNFTHRFWEDETLIQSQFCVVGGQAATDLASRNVIYPSYGYKPGQSVGGTLLIYNWNTDAARWSGMSHKD